MSRLDPKVPCLAGEFDVCIPKRKDMVLGAVFSANFGKAAVLERFETPTGLLERTGCCKPGDVLIGLNGVSLIDLTPEAVSSILESVMSNASAFVYLRFLTSGFNHVDLKFTSMGSFGSKLPEKLRRKNKFERKTVLHQRSMLQDRSLQDGIYSDEVVPKGVGWDGLASSKIRIKRTNKPGRITDYNPSTTYYTISLTSSSNSGNNDNNRSGDAGGGALLANSASQTPPRFSAVYLPRSEFLVDGEDFNVKLDFREGGKERKFLQTFSGIDVGDTSDDGEDEDAYFRDNFDSIVEKETQVKANENTQAKDSEEDFADREIKTPLDSKDFQELLPFSAALAGVMVSEAKADEKDFKLFPVDNKKIDAAAKGKKTEENGSNVFAYQADRTKRGAKKVEQLHKDTLQSICVFASIAAASAVVGIPARKINQALNQEYVTGGDGEGDTAGGYKWRYAGPDAEVTKDMAHTAHRQRTDEFVHKLYDYDTQHKYKGGHQLRDYQVDGVNWLAEKWYKKQSCILADEMGLGKTVQIVSLIEHLHRVEKKEQPYLIVVPLSTLEHWRREFQGWTDLRVNIYHDTKREWR